MSPGDISFFVIMGLSVVIVTAVMIPISWSAWKEHKEYWRRERERLFGKDDEKGNS